MDTHRFHNLGGDFQKMSTVRARETNSKHPDDSLLYEFEFANLLDDGASLSGTPTVVEIDTADLTIGSPSIVGTTVQVRISGGTENTLYHVKCQCGDSDGNTWNIPGRLKVSTDEGTFPS